MKTEYPLVPLSDFAINLIKNTLGLTTENACDLRYFRKFTDTFVIPVQNERGYKEDRAIEVDNKKANISIIRPLGSEQKILPVILFVHGGGWVLGNYPNYALFINEMVARLDCCIVFVHYSLSPEARFPTAIEECYTALCWIQKNSKEYRMNTDCIAIMGDSSGANMGAAVSMIAKERGNRGITQQVFFYPMMDPYAQTASREKYKDGKLMNYRVFIFAHSLYLGNYEGKDQPLVAPLRATIDDMRNLPPTITLTAELDGFRDEGEEYAKRLKKAGVRSLSIRFNGVKHGFVTFGFPKIAPEGIFAIQQAIEWLKKEWFPASKL